METTKENITWQCEGMDNQSIIHNWRAGMYNWEFSYLLVHSTMMDNKNDSSDSMYEQLQEFLNECIKLWRLNKIFDKGIFVLEDWVYRNQWRIPMFSFHDLFSKDSGIMEFVEWKSWTDVKQEYSNAQHNREWHYKRMCMLTAEHKVQYFISNAKVPWN
jgi:hypothetical protein